MVSKKVKNLFEIFLAVLLPAVALAVAIGWSISYDLRLTGSEIKIAQHYCESKKSSISLIDRDAIGVTVQCHGEWTVLLENVINDHLANIGVQHD